MSIEFTKAIIRNVDDVYKLATKITMNTSGGTIDVHIDDELCIVYEFWQDGNKMTISIFDGDYIAISKTGKLFYISAQDWE